MEPIEIGHWHFFKDFNPEQFVGFIYCITHKASGRKYIGKKFFWKTIRKPIKNRKNRKRVTKCSDWKKYTGSSNWLNSEIDQFGIDAFDFQILSLHESRGTLAYTEIETLIKLNVLREKLIDGTKAYYNGLVPPCKFTPGEETEIEKQFKV